MLRERTLNYPISRRDRVTATEIINGTKCLVVLEQDMFGCYREKSVQPLKPTSLFRLAEATWLNPVGCCGVHASDPQQWGME